MTKIPDELLEAEFTKAHNCTDTISASLEHLKEAISNENYLEASEQFGLVLQNTFDRTGARQSAAGATGAGSNGRSLFCIIR